MNEETIGKNSYGSNQEEVREEIKTEVVQEGNLGWK